MPTLYSTTRIVICPSPIQIFLISPAIYVLSLKTRTTIGILKGSKYLYNTLEEVILYLHAQVWPEEIIFGWANEIQKSCTSKS